MPGAAGRYRAALRRLQDALSASPPAAELYYNLGNALQRLHRFDEAMAAYRRVLHLRPSYVDAGWNLGLILLRLGRFPEGSITSGDGGAPAPPHRAAHAPVPEVDCQAAIASLPGILGITRSLLWKRALTPASGRPQVPARVLQVPAARTRHSTGPGRSDGRGRPAPRRNPAIPGHAPCPVRRSGPGR